MGSEPTPYNENVGRAMLIAAVARIWWPGATDLVPSSPGEPSAHRSHYCGMQWIEALINISAFLGFVGVANLGGKTCDPEEPVG